jgi:hypothetical protein
MRIIEAVAVSVLATTFSFGAMAEANHHPEKGAEGMSSSMTMGGAAMPMGKEGMKGSASMGMMAPEKMKKMQEMMKLHMKNMEQGQANIEALLKELVAMQKAG